MQGVGLRSRQTCTFRARRRAGVWRITRDHVFYGDFLSRDAALRSAFVGARSFEAAGGVACVLIGSADVIVAHEAPAVSPGPTRPGAAAFPTGR
jgi:hypothetical protein